MICYFILVDFVWFSFFGAWKETTKGAEESLFLAVFDDDIFTCDVHEKDTRHWQGIFLGTQLLGIGFDL